MVGTLRGGFSSRLEAVLMRYVVVRRRVLCGHSR